MDTRPSVSVVVPVYNGAGYLPGCLASIEQAVRALTPAERAKVEVIVCDNWSDDGSREIAEAVQMPARYEIVQPERHEPNRTRNWSAGLARATGSWMVMLHADDLMARGGLASLLRATERPEAAGATMIVGRHRTFRDPAAPGRAEPRWRTASLIPGALLARAVLALHCPFVPFVLMRRSAYEQIGGLDERWELVQDYELWIRLSAVGDVLLVPEEVGWWRVHDTSPRYREINAREHVTLARLLPQHIRRLPAGGLARARRVSLARAAVQLDGIETDAAPWLGDDRLPSVATAHETLTAMYRMVTARLVALRVFGVVRRIPPLARSLARQH